MNPMSAKLLEQLREIVLHECATDEQCIKAIQQAYELGLAEGHFDGISEAVTKLMVRA